MYCIEIGTVNAKEVRTLWKLHPDNPFLQLLSLHLGLQTYT